jgi:membrane-associated phospholipid phosphatase
VQTVTASSPVATAKRHTDKGIENAPVNIALFRWINGHHTPALDWFFLLYSYLGMGYVVVPVLLYAWFWRRPMLWPLIIALLVETALVLVLKNAIDQPRPVMVLPDVRLLIKLRYYSFPSGDAAMAFVIAAVMQQGERLHGKLLWWGYAVLIAYERVYVGVHFPLDVAAGAILGVWSARGAFFALRLHAAKRERALPEKPSDV